MPFDVKCDGCGRQFRAPDKLAGKRVKCPQCQAVILVGLSLVVAEVIDRLLMPASVSLPIVGAAMAVSVAIGVASGLIPAFRAARLRPIEALHHE